MRSFCEFIAKRFYKWNIITNKEDINPLRFAFELILTQTITFLSFLIIGLYFGVLYETVVYVAFFIILRKIIQGYHAKTFFMCYVFTMVNYIIVIGLCKMFHSFIYINIVSLVLIGVILSRNVYKEKRKIISITIIYVFVLFTMHMLKLYKCIDIYILVYASVLLMRVIGENDNESSDSG